MHAWIVDGAVYEIFVERPAWADRKDVRDVSGVAGVAVGWRADGAGVFHPPPPPPPPSRADLVTHAKRRHAALTAAGLSVNVADQGDPELRINIATGGDGLARLASAAAVAAQNPSESFTWIEGDAPRLLTASQIVTMYAAASTYIQACYTTLGEVLAGVAAEPATIASYAAVDAADWPSNG